MVQHSSIDHTGITGAGGSVATDAIFDAKGDLAAGTGANTAAKLTVGANDTILMADSGQSTGLKWVAAGTPTDQDYDDVAAAGTADTFARGDHLHGMPSAGGGGPGTLLAYVYDTASGNVNITSTTLVDVDATNAITASFTAPASGHVICRIVGTGTTSGDINSFVGVRESTSILGSKVFAMNSQFLRDEQFSAVVDLTGLSAGSHTFKIAACINSGTMTIRSSATNPLSMEVIQGA